MTTSPETTLFPVDPATVAKNLYTEVERLGKAYEMGVRIATGKQKRGHPGGDQGCPSLPIVGGLP
jgi:hypothetical protein